MLTPKQKSALVPWLIRQLASLETSPKYSKKHKSFLSPRKCFPICLSREYWRTLKKIYLLLFVCLFVVETVKFPIKYDANGDKPWALVWNLLILLCMEADCWSGCGKQGCLSTELCSMVTSSGIQQSRGAYCNDGLLSLTNGRWVCLWERDSVHALTANSHSKTDAALRNFGGGMS